MKLDISQKIVESFALDEEGNMHREGGQSMNVPRRWMPIGFLVLFRIFWRSTPAGGLFKRKVRVESLDPNTPRFIGKTGSKKIIRD